MLGRPERAPYDRILVSAERIRHARSPLARPARATAGRLVVPVRSRMTLVVQRDGDREVSRHGSYRFVPLL